MQFGKSRFHFYRFAAWLVAVGVVLTGSAYAFAQSSGAAASSPAINPVSGAMPTLSRLFLFSPIINGIIVILSIIAVMMFLFFLVTINHRIIVRSDVVDELAQLVQRGRFDEAGDVCRRHKRVFTVSVLRRCLANAGKSHSAMTAMIDSEGRRRADIIWNRISYLSDISNVAPMFGLLGTVVGMMRAFFGLGLQTASVNSGVLAEGVGQAMSTTMFGLIVAIIALIFYSIIKSRVTKALAEAEQAVYSVVDYLDLGASEPSGSYEEDKTRSPIPAAPVLE